jgi:hypothetical protein
MQQRTILCADVQKPDGNQDLHGTRGSWRHNHRIIKTNAQVKNKNDCSRFTRSFLRKNTGEKTGNGKKLVISELRFYE